jgi:fructokinase
LGAAQALAMVDDARGSVTISFDPNCRPNLVKRKARYVDRMDAFAAAADIVRMSDVDFEYLYGGSDYARRARSLLDAGASLVVVTRGIRGAQAWHGAAGTVEVEAPTVSVVDTIGAGDSFQAALLFALRAIGRIRKQALAQMNSDELGRALSFASSCAAFTCGRAGADPPRQSDVALELSGLFPD